MTRLSVEQLRVELIRHGTRIAPVDDVSFALDHAEILGVAGESGSGKSLTLKAISGLLPGQSRVTGDLRADLDGNGLVRYRPADVRGRGISFVFQEPTTALNPTARIGDQIALAARVHERLGRRAARAAALELMDDVGIPDPARRATMWPHELSGGLRQRAMIAIALSSNPKVLLCDEPTTALDVSIQDQILALLLRLRDQRGLSIIFVTHDLAVLRSLCDRVAVMYAGRLVEIGPTTTTFDTPRHPYTAALLRSIPPITAVDGPFPVITGQPPDPGSMPPGCRFAPRCEWSTDACRSAGHRLLGGGHDTACIRADELALGPLAGGSASERS